MAANMGFPADGEDDQGWKLYLTSLIMILSAGLCVVARVLTRVRIFELKADDYAIIASLAFSIFLSVAIQLAVVHGYGKHVRDLSTPELRTCLMFFWLAQTPYKVVVCLNKTSVMLLYMRIFIGKRFRHLCFAALTIVIGSGAATVFSTIFQCIPLERSWNKTVEGKCIDSAAFWVANAVINVSTDVIVLALPIHEVAKLQLKLRDKIMLHSVFLLGGFVTVTSILRITAVANSVHNLQDQTWGFIRRGVWTLIEANLGIICACLIVLRHPLARLCSKVFGTTKTGTSEGYRYGYSGGGATLGTTGSSKRDLRRASTRQHARLEDKYDCEDAHESFDERRRRVGTEDMWAGGDSFKMTAVAWCGAAETARKSDERYILPASATEEDFSQISIKSSGRGAGWAFDKE
ncbi:hypothetical protein P171DRAFT_389472 [Karstenula rhodostoma CBS 690.94]|uniref:Rhodopsin domain-containing protein n=1 Tax=Karstenula rhodostoma CBS 690.94 TaxID=1392251 RepID=A0A9P4PG09_9PLEO|nr:hypothetical protein P171DRAFT_389472 [Karstenula rhodostoma CBS 690.94]